MKTILSNRTDPYFNLAWEEYIFKHINLDEDILLLWQNEPAVIVGRNQNIFGEVNLTYCEVNQIPIIRRVSGGGTVYHDLGNLNYTIITKHYQDVISNYDYFTSTIIAFLNQLGVDATFSGKSDIKIDGKKISGNAQMYHQNRMLHHGTILFNTDLNKLNKVIKQITPDMQTVGVPSNRSMVTNVIDYLEPKQTIESFKQQLLLHYLYHDIDQHIHVLSDKDLKHIEHLKSTKYMSWDWNYGESPIFEIRKQINDAEILIKVSSGRITSCSLLCYKDEILLSKFVGIKYDKESFVDTLNQLDSDKRLALSGFVEVLFE